jgi:uracil phosphoribosyltransferase
MFVCYEALKHLETKEEQVETPLCTTTWQRIANEVLLVPILRAGVGMLDGVLRLIPTARVGFVGLYRDPETKLPVEYYQKLPAPTDKTVSLLIDPMLATGGSAVATLDILKQRGFHHALLACLVACPEGIAAVEQAHPEVPIYAASVDDHLNENKYIVPGLGDAGDRLYGTR